MAKITRFNLKGFGSSGPTGDFGVFGSLAAAAAAYSKDPATIQSLTAWLYGWANETISNNRPALEDQNAVDFVFGQALCYLMQAGIPEWETGTTYYQYSFCQKSGIVYRSITDNNTGNDPAADTTNWLANPFNPSGSQVSSDYSEYTTYSRVTGTIPLDNTKPQNTEGVEIFTKSYTPKAIGNTLVVEAILNGANVDGGDVVGALFQDAGADAIAADSKTGYANWEVGLTLRKQGIVIASLSAITFKIRMGSDNGSAIDINGSAGAGKFGGVKFCSISIKEIQA